MVILELVFSKVVVGKILVICFVPQIYVSWESKFPKAVKIIVKSYDIIIMGN